MDDETLTEHRAVAFPQVFGYLRLLIGGPARHAALVGCLSEYCRQHELRLCGVFTDRATTASVRTPAFIGLLDALELPDTYGTVVPALGHLGPKRLATERKRQITAVGARLLVVRATRTVPGRSPSLGRRPDRRRRGGR
ncbi:hypothetical protein ACH4NF_33100 [Streptomyces sp. NPDC017248]|uniref:hypothetical protein n=1 Tax=unclassified Streptomyces TaxID=2593676 RepID=UPI003794422B